MKYQRPAPHSKKLSQRSFLRNTLAASMGAAVLRTHLVGAESGAKGKRIGFVDDNPSNYHSDVFLKALRGPLQERGFVVAGCTGLKRVEGLAWAQKNSIPYFDDDKALNEAVDFYMVLAPSTPDTHLELCQRVLPFGKPTYVDKTFAPNHAIARDIFALADRHHTPMQTTSALRYTNVQAEVRKLAPARVQHAITWGGGGSFDEYAIHPLELLISILGPEALSLMRRGTGARSQLLINFSGERTAVVNVYPQSNTPFAASLTTEKGTQYHSVDAGPIFINNAAAVLDFFASGKPNIDRNESLTIMRCLDAARDPRALREFIPMA